MTLPLSPRADYLAWIMLTASANAPMEQRVDGLREIAGQAKPDPRLTPKDLEIILGAAKNWIEAMDTPCPWCGNPDRFHRVDRICTGLEMEGMV